MSLRRRVTTSVGNGQPARRMRLCRNPFKLACGDSYKRLLSMSMETEIRLATKKKADETAIKMLHLFCHFEAQREIWYGWHLSRKTLTLSSWWKTIFFEWQFGHNNRHNKSIDYNILILYSYNMR